MADAEGLVDIEEFARLDFRVGTVREAEGLEGSDKLVVLKVDTGSEVRQIVAGIRATYSPEQLIGKKVVVLTNLKKASIRGVESDGMILAADAGSGVCLVAPESEIDNGVRVR